MMYNRYIPDAAGVYHPTRVGAEPQTAAPAPPPEPVCTPPAPPPPPPPPPCTAEHGGFLSRLLPRSIDTGDLLMLLILLFPLLAARRCFGRIAPIWRGSYAKSWATAGILDII